MPRYKNNQIIEMVCQLRFSTILRLNNDSDELLSEFQEKIKDNYPNYKMIDESVFNVKMDGAEKELESITPQILRNNIKNHTFESADGKERINLTCNFISFSTKKYICWQEFEEKFIEILDKFTEIYGVKNFNRVGIRYINAFSKYELGINEKDSWKEYISDELIGLSTKYDDVRVYNSKIELPFKDNIQMRILYGLGTKQKEDKTSLPVFIIDKDTYKLGNIEKSCVSDILKILHKHNSEVFEQLIKDKLREKMGVIEDD